MTCNMIKVNGNALTSNCPISVQKKQTRKTEFYEDMEIMDNKKKHASF